MVCYRYWKEDVSAKAYQYTFFHLKGGQDISSVNPESLKSHFNDLPEFAGEKQPYLWHREGCSASQSHSLAARLNLAGFHSWSPEPCLWGCLGRPPGVPPRPWSLAACNLGWRSGYRGQSWGALMAATVPPLWTPLNLHIPYPTLSGRKFSPLPIFLQSIVWQDSLISAVIKSPSLLCLKILTKDCLNLRIRNVTSCWDSTMPNKHL